MKCRRNFEEESRAEIQASPSWKVHWTWFNHKFTPYADFRHRHTIEPWKNYVIVLAVTVIEQTLVDGIVRTSLSCVSSPLPEDSTTFPGVKISNERRKSKQIVLTANSNSRAGGVLHLSLNGHSFRDNTTNTGPISLKSLTSIFFRLDLPAGTLATQVAEWALVVPRFAIIEPATTRSAILGDHEQIFGCHSILSWYLVLIRRCTNWAWCVSFPLPGTEN